MVEIQQSQPEMNEIISEIRFPGYADQEVQTQILGEKSSIDGVKFFGQSNNSCYVVKVTSPSEIYLDSFDFHIQIHVNDKRTSSACCLGVFITNKSWITSGISGISEANIPGNLRFVHFKFGKLNYTYEHRLAYNITRKVIGSRYREPQKPVLPPGTWYFIYFGCIYDLPQEDTIVTTAAWINFTDECTDLQISSYEDGKLFGIWYGEFDANIIISKAWRVEMMINGRTRFPIKNTFIYEFREWPVGTGFWKVRLITPEEIHKLNMIIFRNYHYPDIDFQHKCIRGIEDRSGDYELRVDYIDNAPFLCRGETFSAAFPSYFLGLDVDLR